MTDEYSESRPKPVRLRNGIGGYTKFCSVCLDENPNQFTPLSGRSYLCKDHYEIFRRQMEADRIKARRSGVITQKDAKSYIDNKFLVIYGNRYRSQKRWSTIRAVIIKEGSDGIITPTNLKVILNIIDKNLYDTKKELQMDYYRRKGLRFRKKSKRRNTDYMKGRIVDLVKEKEPSNETN
jgi:hypothetical protein